jgi:CRISPR-associated protein Cmr2
MAYLFLASVGPVQEFIASARRSRDLWFGSFLLSELSKQAALTIQAHGSLIFPAIGPEMASADLGELSVANKIVAEITSAISAADLGKAVRDSVFDRLDELRKGAFKQRWNADERSLQTLAER